MRAIPIPMLRGLGVSATPGVIPYSGAGTSNDPNCGWACDIPFYQAFAQQCWPCHNICPPGTQWDTTNEVCSSAPQTVNPATQPTPGAVGVLGSGGCPAGQAWNEVDAQCEASCTGPLCSLGINLSDPGTLMMMGVIGIGLLVLLKK